MTKNILHKMNQRWPTERQKSYREQTKIRTKIEKTKKKSEIHVEIEKLEQSMTRNLHCGMKEFTFKKRHINSKLLQRTNKKF